MNVGNLAQQTSFDVFESAMNLIINAESAQDLCRKLVHSNFTSGDVRGAYVFTLDNRSNLIESAGYGVPISSENLEISAWDDHPVSNAIRLKRDVFTPGDTKNSNPAIATLPFIKDSVPTGVLALVLEVRSESSPIPSEAAPAIGKLGAYFLETRGFVSKTNSAPTGRESIEDLTTRQVTILGFMGDGLTNADISHKVLLSESTVRQETIRIYRALAVAGRQEAVAKARALGLIQKLAFTTPPPPSL